MVRVPKFFFYVSSTNLTPDSPLAYEVRASTHHWRGELLEDSWAVAEMEYHNPHHTEQVITIFKEKFLALQEVSQPSKDIVLTLPPAWKPCSDTLSAADRAYYDAVQLATSKGWKWNETFIENQETGERSTHGCAPYRISLCSWEWGGKAIGSSVGFSHFQNDNESKADLLLRTLATAEKAKADFPNSIPCTNIYGQIKVDEFKTRIVFGSK